MHPLLMELVFTTLGEHKPKTPNTLAKEKSDGKHLLAGSGAINFKAWFTKQELSTEAMMHIKKQ